MGDAKEVLAKAARWTGLVASLFTLVLGVVHICDRSARINWPSDKFTDDVNGSTWRQTLFTFDPEVFLDAWTPVFFGLVGTLCHFNAFKFDIISENFLKFFVFHLVSGLFASIGYEGGLGIIFSVPVWIACLLAMIAAFVCPGRANLELNLNCTIDDVKSGNVIRTGS